MNRAADGLLGGFGAIPSDEACIRILERGDWEDARGKTIYGNQSFRYLAGGRLELNVRGFEEGEFVDAVSATGTWRLEDGTVHCEIEETENELFPSREACAAFRMQRDGNDARR